MVAKSVFCHYMVGLTLNQSLAHWEHDIATASRSAIDGFALNIGANDTFTLDALRGAYDVAAQHGGSNFSLFLSFDFGASAAGDTWTVDAVADLVSAFKDEPAQFRVDGRPLVSTFEGVAFADEWSRVRERVEGGIHFVPDWSSLGPRGVGERIGLIDGHFSFDTWPKPGRYSMSSEVDTMYQEALKGKTYMMGISPYFFTNIPTLDKNWYSASDTLWFDRLEHMLSVQADMVQIISWNDFGESHYIGDALEHQVIPAARPYVDGMSHAGFRAILPYYVAAYKQGKKEITLPPALGDGIVVAWYRTTTKDLVGCGDGGTRWGQHGTATAKDAIPEDSINIIAVSYRKTTLRVSLGGGDDTNMDTKMETKEVEVEVPGGRPRFFQVPFSEFGRKNPRGNVTISMNGVTTVGPEITDLCPESGNLNFNAVAIDLVVPATERREDGDGDENGDTERGGSKPGGGESGAGSQPQESGASGRGVPGLKTGGVGSPWVAASLLISVAYFWALGTVGTGWGLFSG